LIETAEFKGIKQRNVSLLIHGFEARAASVPAGDLRSMLDGLERLFREDSPSIAERLASARFPFGGG
jgi:hypothetical protein